MGAFVVVVLLVVARFEDSLVPTSRAMDNLLLDALRGMSLFVGDSSLRNRGMFGTDMASRRQPSPSRSK